PMMAMQKHLVVLIPQNYGPSGRPGFHWAALAHLLMSPTLQLSLLPRRPVILRVPSWSLMAALPRGPGRTGKTKAAPLKRARPCCTAALMVFSKCLVAAWRLLLS